jgi:hypothetical protein
MTPRREQLVIASRKAMAASDTLTLLAAYEGQGRTPPLAKMIEAEAALYEAIDLLWQAGETVAERFSRIAGEVAAAPHQLERAA